MPEFDDIQKHLDLCSKFHKECEQSWQYQEVETLFKNYFSEPYKALANRQEIIKEVSVGGMLKEHYDTIEMAKTYKRAKDIAEINAIQWMEDELETKIHEALYSEN